MKSYKKYLVSSPDDHQGLGIEILNIGHKIYAPQQSYPDIDHPESYLFNWEEGRFLEEYQIVYISNGEGIFEVNGLPPQLVGPGTVFLLFPGIWHRFKPNPNTGWEEYWVGFQGGYARYLLEQKCFSPENPVISVGLIPEFLDTFSNLISTLEEENTSFEKLASFHVINLLGIVYASVLRSNSNRREKEEAVRRVQNEIHARWNQSVDIHELCKHCDVNYNSFRKSFKETFNTSPGQYLLMLRLRNAVKLIKETNLSISEIAYECGFNSEFYFSRLFKQKMHCNPSDIRKKGT